MSNLPLHTRIADEQIEELESQLAEAKAKNTALVEAARAVVDTEFDDILDEGHDNAVRALAAALPE